MESKPLLSDFDAQIKYYQRLETQIEELPGSYHIGPVEYLTDRIKGALVTETKAWKQAFGKALAEKVTLSKLLSTNSQNQSKLSNIKIQYFLVTYLMTQFMFSFYQRTFLSRSNGTFSVSQISGLV